MMAAFCWPQVTMWWRGTSSGPIPAGTIGLPTPAGCASPPERNNLIGGTVPAARNVISGNNSNTGNIAIEPRFGSAEPAPTGTLIRGNYIGINAGGTAAVETGSFAPRGVVVADRLLAPSSAAPTPTMGR